MVIAKIVKTSSFTVMKNNIYRFNKIINLPLEAPAVKTINILTAVARSP